MEKLKEIVDLYFLILNLIIAFLLFFIDRKTLEEKGLVKEKKVVVGLSIALVTIGPLVYILTMVL
ncbi:hypothetical protein GOQ29_05840 [Clostridium sp. D2Q-14]|uniref:CLC_0170 family protein n=1 Tax=Anaeromonas gelatinilytica TaxID=2683194 RepID=UPI00193B74CC|nr:CLC_0170 family protein [Anaeromonas gelatinilytica]MBS4535140.1 hypothetical protein [Anaeromonas gelatinilytica]